MLPLTIVHGRFRVTILQFFLAPEYNREKMDSADGTSSTPTSAITASYTNWLTWQLDFSLRGKEYYARRGTLYVEMEPGSDIYKAFKPVYSTAHDTDGFKRPEAILEDQPVKSMGFSEEGLFAGVYDACIKI